MVRQAGKSPGLPHFSMQPHEARGPDTPKSEEGKTMGKKRGDDYGIRTD